MAGLRSGFDQVLPLSRERITYTPSKFRLERSGEIFSPLSSYPLRMAKAASRVPSASWPKAGLRSSSGPSTRVLGPDQVFPPSRELTRSSRPARPTCGAPPRSTAITSPLFSRISTGKYPPPSTTTLRVPGVTPLAADKIANSRSNLLFVMVHRESFSASQISEPPPPLLLFRQVAGRPG